MVAALLWSSAIQALRLHTWGVSLSIIKLLKTRSWICAGSHWKGNAFCRDIAGQLVHAALGLLEQLVQQASLDGSRISHGLPQADSTMHLAGYFVTCKACPQPPSLCIRQSGRMGEPASPSSTTSSSYVVAETAGINDDGEVFSGPCANRATQSSGSRKETASGPARDIPVQELAGQAVSAMANSAPASNSPHPVACIHSGGNTMSEPDHRDEPVVEDNSAAQSAEPRPEGFQDYDEELDYMDEDVGPSDGHAKQSSNARGQDVVVPPPLAYIQEAAGEYLIASLGADEACGNAGKFQFQNKLDMPPLKFALSSFLHCCSGFLHAHKIRA